MQFIDEAKNAINELAVLRPDLFNLTVEKLRLDTEDIYPVANNIANYIVGTCPSVKDLLDDKEIKFEDKLTHNIVVYIVIPVLSRAKATDILGVEVAESIAAHIAWKLLTK